MVTTPTAPVNQTAQRVVRAADQAETISSGP